MGSEVEVDNEDIKLDLNTDRDEMQVPEKSVAK
jgi:hypothetical protein